VFTVAGKAPFFAFTDNSNVTVDTTGLTASPGTLKVSTLPAGSTVKITIGDASSPPLTDTETIYCQ
jgi:hypothetical protein